MVLGPLGERGGRALKKVFFVKGNGGSVSSHGKPCPRFRISGAADKVPVLGPSHGLRAARVDHGVARRQEHVLLDAELGQVVVRRRDVLRVLGAADHLGHVTVVFVVADTVKDFRPALVGQLGPVGAEVVQPQLGSAHAGVRHHDDAAGVLEQAGFLRVRHGDLVEEGAVADAGGYAV